MQFYAPELLAIYWNFEADLKITQKWRQLDRKCKRKKKSKMTSGYNITKHIDINEYNI